MSKTRAVLLKILRETEQFSFKRSVRDNQGEFEYKKNFDDFEGLNIDDLLNEDNEGKEFRFEYEEEREEELKDFFERVRVVKVEKIQG